MCIRKNGGRWSSRGLEAAGDDLVCVESGGSGDARCMRTGAARGDDRKKIIGRCERRMLLLADEKSNSFAWALFD